MNSAIQTNPAATQTEQGEATEALAQVKTPSKASMGKRGHAFIVMGASGDLAKKSIYPALWQLFKKKCLPENLQVIGFARSKLTVDDLKEKTEETVLADSQKEQSKLDKFWAMNTYTPGSYNNASDAGAFSEALAALEKKYEFVDYTFYLALPPAVYMSVTNLIKENWMASSGRTKIAIEKPFGTDLASSNELDKHLTQRFEDSQICRIDHYLSLEMVQAILALRFANRIFCNVWNKDSISAVMITFKEDFGTMGRGGYFDKSGIIRDVMQNHMLQVMTLIAMEPPESSDEDVIKEEKAKLVRSIRPVRQDDIVIGQYVGNKDSSDPCERVGYTEDKTVPPSSRTATFATIVFHIDNERWKGVPFIMRAGKAVDEVKDEVRIQFKGISHALSQQFPEQKMDKNELVIQLKPTERISLRITGKTSWFQDGLGNSGT
jgi:glucose-6-phosphate 1-dehydrogenase